MNEITIMAESNANDKSDKSDDGRKRKRVTPAGGKSRGPHPASPPSKEVLLLLSDLPRTGYISRNPDTGYIFLDLDDDWIFNVSDIMESYGYETPPYFYGNGATGAHISLIPAAVGRNYLKEDVEVGKKISLTVTGASPLYPTYRFYGKESLYVVWVESEELEKYLERFNQRVGFKHFHIIVGERSIKTRDQMMKE